MTRTNQRALANWPNNAVSVLDYGAVGDGVTDDTAAIQAAIDYCTSNGEDLYIASGKYLLSQPLTITGRFNITSSKTALMRWTNIDGGFKIEYVSGNLCSLQLPSLFGPAVNSNFVYLGYSDGTLDLSLREGIAVNLKGVNRVQLDILYCNGWDAAVGLESTSVAPVDNIDININTIDLCEKGIYCYSNSGKGFAQVVANINTLFAKHPFYIDSTLAYVNSCKFNVTGGSFVNEYGGSGVYIKGTKTVSSLFNFNQLQAGGRNDSPLSTPVLLIPSGTMGAAPVAGETITQAGTGATGVVAPNTFYSSGGYTAALPFTVLNVTGTFTTAGTLTGSASGSLGANSQPSGVRGLTCPFLAGDQTLGGHTYDGEQTGTLGYAATNGCSFIFGLPVAHPTGSQNGAFNLDPSVGESLRVRNTGTGNILSFPNQPIYAAPVALGTVIGEENFNGGVGGAKFADTVYCTTTLSIPAGSSVNKFFYSTCLSPLDISPVTVLNKNEAFANSQIEAIAFRDDVNEPRRVRLKFFNRSASSFNATVFFFLSFE